MADSWKLRQLPAKLLHAGDYLGIYGSRRGTPKVVVIRRRFDQADGTIRFDTAAGQQVVSANAVVSGRFKF